MTYLDFTGHQGKKKKKHFINFQLSVIMERDEKTQILAHSPVTYLGAWNCPEDLPSEEKAEDYVQYFYRRGGGHEQLIYTEEDYRYWELTSLLDHK